MESPRKRLKSFSSVVDKNNETPEYEYKQVSPYSLKRKRVEIGSDCDWKDDDDILKLVYAVSKWNIGSENDMID